MPFESSSQTSKTALLIFLTALFLSSPSHSTNTDSGVRVGASAVELHAQNDMDIGGFIDPSKTTGQEGMLRAVATVIQGPPDATKIALIGVDVVALRRDSLDRAAREIEKRTGIPFSSILISATHTHAAPSTISVHRVHAVKQFVEQVESAIVQSTVAANQRVSDSPPITFQFKAGREETVGLNSRRWDLSEQTITWFFSEHGGETRPTGPFDSSFPVVVFRRPDQSPMAVLFGHGTHNTARHDPKLRSPEFYGLAAQAYEEETGAITTFFEGAAGSTHLWQLDGVNPPSIATEAQRRVLNALRYTVDQSKTASVNLISSARKEVTVKVRKFDEKQEEVTVANYCRKHCATISADFEKSVVTSFRNMRAQLAKHQGEERKTWVSAMRIGGVAIVGLPAEVFAQLGMDIKRRSPFENTIVVSLANDWIGYVGNADAYPLGGYQLWTGLHSWTEQGTGELLVEEAVSMLNELYAQ